MAGCWMCEYFYIKNNDYPCNECKDRDKFLLWKSESDENKGDKS